MQADASEGAFSGAASDARTARPPIAAARFVWTRWSSHAQPPRRATSEGRKSLPLRVATDGMSATLARQPASRSGVLLRRYIDTFRLALESGNRTCLCGIMGAGHDDLPEAVKTGIGAFADMNEAWLSRVSEGSIAREGGSAGYRASAIYAAILGAQRVARSRNDISLFDRAISCYHATSLLPQEMQA
jgi:hypothetical protein